MRLLFFNLSDFSYLGTKKLNSSTTVPKKFYWSNGDEINAAFWYGSPDSYQGTSTLLNEGCLEIRYAYKKKLNDYRCYRKNDVLCEYFS